MAPTDAVSGRHHGRAASPAPQKSAMANPSNENLAANVTPTMEDLSVPVKIGQVGGADPSPGPAVDVPPPVGSRRAVLRAYLPSSRVCIVATILVVGALLAASAATSHVMNKTAVPSAIVVALGVVVAAASFYSLSAAAPIAKRFVAKLRGGAVNKKVA